jgi:glycosyltransferase involved in cell wall biosynthesis
MKILWLCSWYPNQYIFYNGFFVRRQAEAVAQFADIATLHAVEKSAEILLPDGSKQKITEGGHFEIEINKKTHFEVIVYFPKSNNSIFKLINQFKAYHKGFKLIKREWGTPNLIHLHVIISAGIYALFLHFFYKIPFLITEHSSMYRLETGVFKHSNWVFKTIVRQCAKQAKAIIALSPFYASTMQQHGLINRFFYVPNVVDTDLFQLKNKLKTKGNNNLINSDLINSDLINSDLINSDLIKNKELKTFNLIHVSGLHDSIKNITGILNAIKKLSEIRQDFILDIIGDPLEQPPYKALVQTLGIEKFIRFHHHLPIEEVAKQMQQADIFVLFSRFEGLPCVILEAMSAGLPVVATETGGISDWVTEGSGRLVNSEDEAALVENLDFMMTHLHQFNPELIRKKIVETCSYNAVGQAIVNIYKIV